MNYIIELFFTIVGGCFLLESTNLLKSNILLATSIGMIGLIIWIILIIIYEKKELQQKITNTDNFVVGHRPGVVGVKGEKC